MAVINSNQIVAGRGATNIQRGYATDRQFGMLDSFISVFRTVVRIQTENPSVQLVVAQGDGVANTDMSTGVISLLNEAQRVAVEGFGYRSKQQAAVAILKALCYHEAAHLMFTPKVKHYLRLISDAWYTAGFGSVPMAIDMLSSSDAAKEAFGAWNAVEDARIERMYCALYPVTKKYLTAAVNEFNIPSGIVGGNRFTLRDYLPVAGRTYLPKDMYDYAYSIAVDGLGGNSTDVDALRKAAVIFSKLYDPIDSQRDKAVGALAAIYKIIHNPSNLAQSSASQRLIGSNSDLKQAGVEDRRDDDQAEITDRSERAQKKAQKADKKNGGGQNEQTPDISNGVQGRQHVDDVATEELFSSEGNREYRETMEQIGREEAGEKKDVTGSSRADTFGGEWNSNVTQSCFYTREDQALAVRIAGTLRSLREGLDEGYEPGFPAGKINSHLARAANGTHVDVFDDWRPSNYDAADLECIVLCDASSSMWYHGSGTRLPTCSTNDPNRRALAMSCVVMDACKRAGLAGRIYTFGSSHTVTMASCKEFISRIGHVTLPTNGSSTNPMTSLRRCIEVFSKSKRPNKLLVVITDGEWGQPDEPKSLITKLKGMGVQVALLIYTKPDNLDTLRASIASHGNYGIDHVVASQNPQEIVRLFRTLSTCMIAKSARAVRRPI